MAISNQLASLKAPYVHSNLSRFNSNLKHSFLNNESEEGKRKLEQQIKELERVRDRLKEEADLFLNGKTPAQVLGLYADGHKTMANIGLDILHSPEIIKILMGGYATFDQKDVNKIYKGLKIKSSISERELVNLIAEDLFQSLQGISGKGAAKAQSHILSKKLKGTTEAQMSEYVKNRLSSKSGKIKKIIKDIIRQKTKNVTTIKKQFIVFFKSEFLKRTDELKFYSKEQVDNYLQAVEQGVNALPDGAFTGEYSSTVGKVGEDFFKIITTSDESFTCEIELTGMDFERDILNKFDDKVASIMKTHHGDNTESQTDMLITNSAGKTVRVQSKNLQTAYESVISINQKPFPGLAQLQSETSYLGLMAQLEKAGTLHLTAEEQGVLSYLLANEIWFRNRKSMEASGIGNEGRAKGVSKKGSTLEYTAKMVNNLFSQEITNFIGININDIIGPVQVNKASSSNVFYLISNKILLPVYCVLEELIKQLRSFQTELSTFSVSLVTSGFNLPRADAFYAEKLQSVGKFDSKANYTEGNILSVGQAQGANIISQLHIRKVGLKFNLENLMKTSFIF